MTNSEFSTISSEKQLITRSLNKFIGMIDEAIEISGSIAHVKPYMDIVRDDQGITHIKESQWMKISFEVLIRINK